MTAGTPQDVRAALNAYGAVVREHMAGYFPKGLPAAYLYDLLPDYPNRGGKMFRPTLCLATARAFGAPMHAALATAVAIELLHNALLIHDDIEDESEQRRDRPTLNASHGVPLALNVGDALGLLSLRPLIENVGLIGPRLAAAVLRETERMAWETVEGQAMELGWRRDNALDLTDADYLVMVCKKTCWLTSIYPARVGALIATRDRADLEPFIRFGFFLGAAFQIQDDLLNLEPDEGYGKEINGDLYEGKRTLMLLHALRHAAPQDREKLKALLAPGRDGRTAEEVAWMRALMDRHGSLIHARGIAHGLAGAALHEFGRAFAHLPDSPDKRFLSGLAIWLFERR